MLEKGYGVRAIARVLGRSPGSISEEVKRNSVKGQYDPRKADHKAYVRAKYRRFQWQKIEQNSELKTHIIQGLNRHWNPDEIAGRMKHKQLSFYASKTAIYDWLRTSRGDRYYGLLYSRRHRVKRRKPRTKRILIPNRIGIEKRPLGATNRTRYGHWEGDTLVSGRQTGSKAALSVLYERKAKYVTGRKLPNLKPASQAQAVRTMTSSLLVKSSTWDNGIENQDHEAFGMPTYFCDAYASWQKPGVENVNKLLRRYFPKGMNLSSVNEKELERVLSLVNGKPRRSLGFQTAQEVAVKHGILKKYINVRCSD